MVTNHVFVAYIHKYIIVCVYYNIFNCDLIVNRYNIRQRSELRDINARTGNELLSNKILFIINLVVEHENGIWKAADIDKYMQKIECVIR